VIVRKSVVDGVEWCGRGGKVRGGGHYKANSCFAPMTKAQMTFLTKLNFSASKIIPRFRFFQFRICEQCFDFEQDELPGQHSFLWGWRLWPRNISRSQVFVRES